MKNKILIFGVVALVSLGYGCKKSYLDTAPSDAITDENLFATTESAYAVLNGMNRTMTTNVPALGSTNNAANDWGAKTFDLASDVLGNDVVCSGSEYDWFDFLYKYTTLKNSSSRDATMGWAFYYKIVNAANIIITNIDNAVGPDEEKADIKGQGYAYRAWAYYNLSVYYCKPISEGANNPGLPIYTTPTSGTTTGASRSSIGDVYNLIEADVEQAISLLRTAPAHSNKSFISLATAYGIGARVALVREDWAKAAERASFAIDQVGGEARLMDSATYRAGFNSASNSEFMWASALTADQTASFGNRSWFSFVDPTNPSSYATVAPRRITKQLQDLIRTGDVRKTTFNAARGQTKFRLADGSTWIYDNLYMRLAEMFLIKAEAEAKSGNSTGAIQTLETLVKKRNASYNYASGAYVTGVPAASKLVEEIYLQRRIELFLEGFSYHDIRRLKKGLNRPSGSGNHNIAIAVKLTIQDNSDDFLFRIPQSEIDPNPNMSEADQNP